MLGRALKMRHRTLYLEDACGGNKTRKERRTVISSFFATHKQCKTSQNKVFYLIISDTFVSPIFEKTNGFCVQCFKEVISYSVFKAFFENIRRFQRRTKNESLTH